jgi:hypothetical protein
MHYCAYWRWLEDEGEKGVGKESWRYDEKKKKC